MSDHVLCASPLLASKLSRLFTALLRHGYTAECLCDSIIHPIPKGLKDPAISIILSWDCFGFLSQQIIGTVRIDVISGRFVHIRFAVWVQKRLLYRSLYWITETCLILI